LSGPLQNLEIVYQTVSSFGFYIILQADLQASIFYFITAFVLSYTLLKKMHRNDGVLWVHPIRVFLERYFRLVPLYVFMIFFLWKFLGLLGG